MEEQSKVNMAVKRPFNPDGRVITHGMTAQMRRNTKRKYLKKMWRMMLYSSVKWKTKLTMNK